MSNDGSEWDYTRDYILCSVFSLLMEVLYTNNIVLHMRYCERDMCENEVRFLYNWPGHIYILITRKRFCEFMDYTDYSQTLFVRQRYLIVNIFQKHLGIHYIFLYVGLWGEVKFLFLLCILRKWGSLGVGLLLSYFL